MPCRFLQNIKFKNLVTIIALINNCVLQITDFMFFTNHITVFYFGWREPSTEKIIGQQILPIRFSFFGLNNWRRRDDHLGVWVRPCVCVVCTFRLRAFACLFFFSQRHLVVHAFPAPSGAHVVRLANVRLAVVFVLYRGLPHFLEEFRHCPKMFSLFNSI